MALDECFNWEGAGGGRCERSAAVAASAVGPGKALFLLAPMPVVMLVYGGDRIQEKL